MRRQADAWSRLVVVVALVVAACGGSEDASGPEAATTPEATTTTQASEPDTDLGEWADNLVAMQEEMNANLQQVAVESLGGDDLDLAESTMNLMAGFGSVLNGSLQTMLPPADGSTLSAPYATYRTSIEDQAAFSEQSASEIDANLEEYKAAFQQDQGSSRIEELFSEFSRLDANRETACFGLQQAMTDEGLPLLVCTVGGSS